jgi:hypothetical protein
MQTYREGKEFAEPMRNYVVRAMKPAWCQRPNICLWSKARIQAACELSLLTTCVQGIVVRKRRRMNVSDPSQHRHLSV